MTVLPLGLAIVAVVRSRYASVSTLARWGGGNRYSLGLVGGRYPGYLGFRQAGGEPKAFMEPASHLARAIRPEGVLTGKEWGIMVQ